MSGGAAWVVMGLALVAYALTGGADYGGGVWDLLARRPRRIDVVRAIERGIAPIWEANHVWLIFMVVLSFTVFPRAFAVLAVALHIPLTVALVGMVLRGSAFVMRAYGMDTRRHRFGWGLVFGISSVLTPFALGVCLAGAASGDIHVDVGGPFANVTSGFLAGWLTPFAFALGVFSVCLFALLAAPAQLFVFLLAVAVCAALVRRRHRLARALAAAQVTVIVAGFGLAMNGRIVMSDVHIGNAGTRPEVAGPLLPALVIGAAVVAPALWFLFRLFKTHR